MTKWYRRDDRRIKIADDGQSITEPPAEDHDHVHVRVFGDAEVLDQAVVRGDAEVLDQAVVRGDAVVCGNAVVSGGAGGTKHTARENADGACAW